MLERLRVHLITPPFSVACFSLFWISSVVLSWFDRGGKLMHAVTRFWSGVLLRTAGVRVETRGIADIPGRGPYVYVSNHLSLADTPLMSACLPTAFRFMAKASLAGVPIIGGHLKRAGHILVEREDARGAVKSLAEAARVIREKGASILIFAEGTRSDGNLQSFKRGAAHLAIECGVPVVPLAVSGTAEILPKKALLLRPGVVRLCAGPPIPAEGLTSRDRERLTGEIQEAVSRLLDGVLQAAG